MYPEYHKDRAFVFLFLLTAMWFSRLPGQSLFVQGIDTVFARRMFMNPILTDLLPEFDDSYGVVFQDINQDNLPDLYVVRFRNLNRLFINPGSDFPFLDYTIQSGLGGNLMPRKQINLELGAAAGDLNNDGLMDIIIAGWGVSTRVFLQGKNLRFTDITDKSGITRPLDANGAFLADVNLDGNLDIFFSDEHYSNRLFLGDGLGHFSDQTEKWNLNEEAVSEGAAFSDVDEDGWPDLYVCNWFTPDFFYRNTGHGVYKQIFLNIPHLTDSLNSNGVSFGDINNDGQPDMMVTDRNGQSRLYLNRTNGDTSAWSFEDITRSAGIDIPYPAYGTVIADLNNDGWRDIWVNTIGPNMFFQNLGAGRFKKTYEQNIPAGKPPKYYSTGAAAADFNLDGGLDLFVANKDTHSVLYVNPDAGNRYIAFELEGVSANRTAIGAKVRLYSTEAGLPRNSLIAYQEITSAQGYLSQNEFIAHFGVDSSRIYNAGVTFPGGKTILLENLHPGRMYVVRESTGFARLWIRGKQFLWRTLNNPDFLTNSILTIALLVLLFGFTLMSTERYHWSARQSTVFLAFMLVFMVGAFMALEPFTPKNRLFIQLGLLTGIIVLLSVFQEKIRRLELQRLQHRRLLQNFSRQLIFIKDNSDLVTELSQTVFKIVRSLFCAVYLKEDHQLRLVSTAGEYSGVSVLPAGEEKVGQLVEMEKGDPSLFSDRMTEQLGIQNSVVVGLRRADRLYGILVVGPTTRNIDFRKEDLSIFRTVAAQAAIAIENNNYIEDSRKMVKRLTEAETRERYLAELEKAYKELEEKNHRLEQLYTDLKEAQSQLIQSEKMAGLGQLMAGIAHELNNPIGFIYANLKELDSYAGTVQSLLEPLIKTPLQQETLTVLKQRITELSSREDLDFILNDLHKLIQESLMGSIRVKEIVQTLRNFSRVDEAEWKEVDLHEGLDSTLILLNNEIKDRITIHKEYGSLPRVACNPGQINQVFMNIISNAVQAIEKNGNIWINTRRSGESVEISIRDDGNGIPPEQVSKIFDPFFTTKPVGKGTGLGLSISYRIIQNHKGNISVESAPGRGTTFRVTLPVQPV